LLQEVGGDLPRLQQVLREGGDAAGQRCAAVGLFEGQALDAPADEIDGRHDRKAADAERGDLGAQAERKLAAGCSTPPGQPRKERTHDYLCASVSGELGGGGPEVRLGGELRPQRRRSRRCSNAWTWPAFARERAKGSAAMPAGTANPA